MTRVEWFAPPANPAEKAAVLSENRRRGWVTVPGTMDQDGGYPMNGDRATAPLWIPNRNTLPTGLAPLRLWPLPVVLGLAALAGALGGWLA